jgi:hypothetical protein
MKVYKQKKQLYCLYECQNICYPTQIIEKGTLLIQNGKVKKTVTLPKHHYQILKENLSILLHRYVYHFEWKTKRAEGGGRQNLV